jgi:hypothetical protein
VSELMSGPDDLPVGIAQAPWQPGKAWLYSLRELAPSLARAWPELALKLAGRGLL